MLKIKEGRLPIAEMLSQYAEKNLKRFHMPGHKGVPQTFLRDIYSADITELDFSDNLLYPDGVIAEAQTMFADLYQVPYAYFCTNGGTAGVFAIIGASEGDILVERASHPSVFNALQLYHKKAVAINNAWKENRFLPITLEQVKLAVSKNPQIKNLLITYPNYYGECCDIKNIAKFCADNSITLLADSAHGAHFGIHGLLPKHAAKFCAACVVSTHKTLPAFTQTAVILGQDAQFGAAAKEKLNQIHTSSPNYVLLASIDWARYTLQHYAKDSTEKVFSEVRKIKEMNAHLQFLENEDFTRLVFDVSSLGLTGGEADSILRQHGIASEFFDDRRVVLIVSVFEQQDDFKKLSVALKSFTGMSADHFFEDAILLNTDFVKLDYRKPVKETELADICDCIGRTAAENICIYPPSVPVVLQGEIISQTQAEFLQLFAKRVFPAQNGKVRVLRMDYL